MRLRSIILFVTVLMPAAAFGQAEVWLKVEEGRAVYLDPEVLEWIPAEERQRVPAQAFLLTDPDTRAVLFRATESYELPADAYLFVSDVFPRSRVDVVDALTRIEASQLPSRQPPQDAEDEQPLGLTYGERVPTGASTSAEVPHQAERQHAVTHFYEKERYDAALLMLKRSMNKFPDLYADEANVELLMDLYAHFRLYGFLLDECDRLMDAPQTESFAQLLQDWRGVAQDALARRER